MVGIAINTVAADAQLQFDIIYTKTAATHGECPLPEAIQILGEQNRTGTQEEQYEQSLHMKKLARFVLRRQKIM